MHTNRILCVGVFVVSLVGVALAQTLGPSRSAGPEAAQPKPADTVIQAQLTNQTLATQLIGATAYSRGGDELGRVTDLLLDDGGRLAGLVVTIGGFFGVGGKAIAVPYGMIEVVKASDRTMTGVRIGLTKAEAGRAPAFMDNDDLRTRTDTSRPQQQTQREVPETGRL